MIVKFIESMIDDVALEVIAHNLKVNIRTAPYDCDQYGLECDVVPHFDNNMFMLAEIKSGSAHIGHAAKNLKRLKELIVKNRMTTPMP